MMRIYLFILTAVVAISCSSGANRNTVSISTASSGIVKNHDLNFPIYLTNTVETRSDIVTKTSSNVYIVHTGHILKPDLTREQNEEVLASLEGKGIDVVNLTLEDFIIADHQGISFEKYRQQFLNSSVMDLNEDSIVTKDNIAAYVIHDGVALIGLSDKTIDKSLSIDKFLVSDYVLSVLRARKTAQKDNLGNVSQQKPLKSFVIVHTMGSEINDVMDRLPPSFINSLAD